ncbi:MAG: CPBP family intramembrane metalloprotease [Simkaniaceae bacterium]|nr:CPBP family intramembrane metalloprotease [Simkaniaceae bacterium]
MSLITSLPPYTHVDLEAQRLNDEQNEQYTLISKIALGVFVGIVKFSGIALLEVIITQILSGFGIELTETQACMQILEDCEDPLMQKLIIAEICLIGPIIEEIIFRSGIDNGFQFSQYLMGYDPDSTTQKTIRFATASLIFGALHLTPEQGYLNIPIFIFTTLAGVVYHYLKEETGDIIAPSAAHITNNTLVMIT